MKELFIDQKVIDEILFKSHGLSIMIGRNSEDAIQKTISVLAESKDDPVYLQLDGSEDIAQDFELVGEIEASDLVVFKDISGARDFAKALAVAAIGTPVICAMEGDNINKTIDVLKLFARTTGYDWFDVERHLLSGLYLANNSGVKGHIFAEKIDLSVLPKKREDTAA